MKMKKGILIFLVLVTGILMTVGSSWAISIPADPLGIKFIDQTFSDLKYGAESRSSLVNSLPSHPNQTATPSENVWGILSMQSLHILMDGQPELQNLSGDAYYSPGDDAKYYYGVFGGLTVIDMQEDEIRLGADTTSTAGAYLKIYEHTTSGAYDTDWTAGPGLVAGTEGHFNTFGTNITSGTLWLDTVFSPGTLANYDTGYVNGELELINLTTATAGSAEAYLDIIGGTAEHLFVKNVFPFSFTGIPGTEADLKFISDLTGQYTGGNWAGSWTASSEDPLTGIGTPEPATMLLLGSGLIGLAGLGRKKKFFKK